jgi:hypothetical protein
MVINLACVKNPQPDIWQAVEFFGYDPRERTTRKNKADIFDDIRARLKG